MTVEETFIPRIKDLMIDTYLATWDQLNPNGRKNVFELFGYDFMIDEDFWVWLVEVNTNPFLGVPNKFIDELLPRMLNEMMMIAVDPVYGPKNKQSLNTYNYEIIYSEEHKINHRWGFDQIYPPQSPVNDEVNVEMLKTVPIKRTNKFWNKEEEKKDNLNQTVRAYSFSINDREISLNKSVAPKKKKKARSKPKNNL